MSGNRIKVQIRGKHEDRDLVRLPALLAELSAVQSVLRRLDKMLSRSKEPTVYYRITTLQYASPALIEIECVPVKPSFDISTPLVERFVGGLESIQKRTAPPDFDYGTLEAYQEIGKSLKKLTTEVLITGNGSRIELKETLVEDVKKIVGEDEIFNGSVSGILEWINIHEGANQFNIYPVAGPTKIECHFPTDLLRKAISSVNRYVEVRGRVRYHQRAQYPHAVDIDDFDIFPEEDELPTLLDIHGIAPDATRGIRSEDFVSGIRQDA